MNEPRSRRPKDLFQAALDVPPEGRDDFLRRACAGDSELEANVRSLLAAHAEAEGFLTGGEVARALADLDDSDLGPVGADPLVGATIGDYRILGLLARGGMGVVYRAEQEHPRREVALKLIDRTFVTPDLLRRFEVEAQLLARLRHPGIAQIYVAGSTGPEHGDRPFFAMELVDGLPLTDYVARQELDLRARLELLIRICAAVQHAHQLGVIHRDLKPANILVTAEGQPKILDFGVARSTDGDLQVTTLAHGQAALIGTLPYMSPEQVRGNPDELDTRSDVHALGVLAYELLTGRLPRDLERRSVTEAIRIIAEEEPRSLARAGSGRFPTDLETIVAKALESDRDRRYDSASGLAQDLQRFLDGQPISARPQSTVYHLRKLVARNKLAAALLGGLVVVSLASAVGMAFMTNRIAGERDRANLQAKTANETSVFLQSLFLDADPEQALGREMNATDLLDRGVDRMQTELLDQPAVRGQLLAILGKVYDSLGKRDRAEPLLAEAVELGRVLREEQASDDDRSNLLLALQYLARCRVTAGANAESIALCREAAAISEAAYGKESEHYATSLNHLAYQLSRVPGHLAEARELALQGLELRQRLLGPEHADVGWSFFQYAWILKACAEPEAALEQARRAVEIWEQALPPDHPVIARGLDALSTMLTQLKRYAEALACDQRALAIRQRTLGPEHPAIAQTLNSIGVVHWRLQDFPAALRSFEAAVEAHEKALGPGDAGLLARLYTVVFMHDLMKNAAGKEATLRRAVELARTYHADDPALLSETTGKLALHLGRSGHEDEALPLLLETATLLGPLGEDRAEDLALILDALTIGLRRAGRHEEALAQAQQLLALRVAHPDWTSPKPHFLRYRIALDRLVLGRFEEAEADLHSLLEEARASFGVNEFFPANVRWLLAHCYHARGAEDEARAHYDAVLATPPDGLGEDLHWLRLRQAEDQAAQGQREGALRTLAAALEAGLDPVEARIALLANPRVRAELREALLLTVRRQ